jgi:hypothetical protein
MQLDGVIKFHVEHETNACCSESDIVELTQWRHKLRTAGLVGQDPARYGGFGFGNLSRRMGDGTFLITASQTGHLETLGPEGYARIVGFDPDRNLVCSMGIRYPSSEAMTHLAAYGANRRIQFVFHAHCPEIWNARDDLDLLITDAAVECGTVDMFYQVRRLLDEEKNYHKGILAMGGHIDGLLAWGETAEEAGSHLLSLLAIGTMPQAA